jgi:hypothetical protein
VVRKILNSPTQPSAITAINAVALVKEKFGPEYCAFIVQPNTVLTIADARGYADSVFYHPKHDILKSWQKAQIDILVLLAETRDLIYKVNVSKNPRGENYCGFDLINRIGLAYSFNSYSFITKADESTLLKIPTISKLIHTLHTILKQKPAFGSYNKIQIMHIASGVILGYPQKAILSTVDSYVIEPDEFGPHDINADIRGGDYYYSCPQPIYSYPRPFATDPDINAHERLWSKILMDFYRSDLHQGLKKDKKFQKQIRELSKY